MYTHTTLVPLKPFLLCCVSCNQHQQKSKFMNGHFRKNMKYLVQLNDDHHSGAKYFSTHCKAFIRNSNLKKECINHDDISNER